MGGRWEEKERRDTVGMKRVSVKKRRERETREGTGARQVEGRGALSHASAHVRCSVTRMRRPASGFHLQQAPRACQSDQIIRIGYIACQSRSSRGTGACGPSEVGERWIVGGGTGLWGPA